MKNLLLLRHSDSSHQHDTTRFTRAYRPTNETRTCIPHFWCSPSRKNRSTQKHYQRFFRKQANA